MLDEGLAANTRGLTDNPAAVVELLPVDSVTPAPS
jgi:hypothetical protein